MKPFAYARPDSLDEAVRLLDAHGPDASILAGGTDLLIELRNWDIDPEVVVDLKRVPELAPAINLDDGVLSISASTVMTDIAEHPEVQRHFVALVESALVVGSVQIRARATLAGNICNGSPAADTAPPLLVYDAVVVVAGPQGTRRVPIDDFIVGPGTTALERGELVTAIELPVPDPPLGAAFTRLTRRRGTDLASITLSCADGSPKNPCAMSPSRSLRRGTGITVTSSGNSGGLTPSVGSQATAVAPARTASPANFTP